MPELTGEITAQRPAAPDRGRGGRPRPPAAGMPRRRQLPAGLHLGADLSAAADLVRSSANVG
jgi:hypothetical protein